MQVPRAELSSQYFLLKCVLSISVFFWFQIAYVKDCCSVHSLSLERIKSSALTSFVTVESIIGKLWISSVTVIFYKLKKEAPSPALYLLNLVLRFVFVQVFLHGVSIFNFTSLFLLFSVCNMRNMMSAMPVIKSEHDIQSDFSPLGVIYSFLKIVAVMDFKARPIFHVAPRVA